MCDDELEHTHALPGGGSGHGLSRRRVLQGMVALAGLSATLSACTAGTGAGAASPLPARPANVAGLNAYVLGMHLHASTSEGVGSMRSQLAQAAANGFDVAWFTEHDWRRRRLLFRPSFSFHPGEVVLGGTWTLPAVPPDGSADGSSGGQVVSTPTTPNDRSANPASLRLRATSTGSSPATVGHRVSSEGTSRANYRSRITGRTVSVDVLPSSTGPDAWAQVLFRLSHHPASGDRPDGVCSIVYRLRPDVTSRTVSRDGTTGIVDVPVTAGRWQTLTFDLTADAGRVWHDMDPRDNSLGDIQFLAVSRRQAPAEVFFGFLRFDEQAGYDAVGVERDLLAAYADDVPHVLGLIGTEISLGPHLNQFGGPQKPYDYGVLTSLADKPGDIRGSIVDFIHAQGGLASINHPFKPADSSLTGDAEGIAHDLLSIGAGGADILEVGYGHKGGATLPDHLDVWDTLSRNGIFLTGNGVSDDHSGQDWASQENRFYTAAWSAARDEPGLLGALSRGRAYVGYLGAFGGTIDMAVDSDIPMGAVAVGGGSSRTVRIDVTGLPPGGAVQVVRGAVDYAGLSTPRPDTKVLASKGAGDLQKSAEVPLDAGDDCFVRLQVVRADGAVVAFGQPTWLLRNAPPHGVPAGRRTRA